MKKMVIAAAFFAAMSPALAHAGAVGDLLSAYKADGAKEFSPERGGAMWSRVFKDPETGESRSCETCHTGNLKAKGKHQKTGEVIEPLAPSANPARLTDVKFIEKWFKRNCKWTLGRECASQEKGDFLLFIQGQ